MSSRPDVAFVLVPGSFCDPAFFHKVTDLLESKGHNAVPVALPSAGELPKPPATMYDDADHIHAKIVEQLESGKDVVLAMSSYGGIPGSQSLKGLSRSERGEGNTAVIGLVYIAALLVLEGVNTYTRNAEDGIVPPPGRTEDDPYMHLPGPFIAPFVFNDLPEPDQLKYYNALTGQSKASFADPLSYAGYRHIPSLYILPTGDTVVKPEAQHNMIDLVNEGLEEGKKVVKIEFPGASHCPMLSRPGEVVEVLFRAAGIDG